MVLIERLEEIKRLWYELELPLRQDIAYVYLDKEQRIIKNIDERLELLLTNSDFKSFLKKLREEHKFKEIYDRKDILKKIQNRKCRILARRSPRGHNKTFQRYFAGYKSF